jgi:hypothetical protein
MTQNKLNELNKAIRLNRELLPIAKALHRLDEYSCNYGLTERQEKRVIYLENKANNIAKEWFNLRAYHQSDPRGASLYLVKTLKEVRNGNYMNGICIY